ncbi:MAG: TonB-dependent receptor [Muribaculaceae bacterium]|nr:TonB-dependent receptor [Muribaculaceae bacterium]
MRKALLILLCCMTVVVAQAQRVNRNYRDVSIADALRQLADESRDYTIYFLYNELEDFHITTQVKNKSLPDAIRQMIGFYPIKMTLGEHHEIYVECTHKARYRLMGRLVNEHGDPMEYANIILLNPTDSSYLTGGVSNASGRFVVPVEKSAVIARISYVGYKTVYRRCQSNKIGTIQMEPSITTLDEMLVTAPKINIRHDGTTLIVSHLDRMVMGNAGTVLDLLRWVPGVVVDAGDHIRVIGRGTTLVYVNNRLVSDINELLSLNSHDIKRIEIVRDPDAQYPSTADAVIKLYTHSPLKNFLGAILTDVVDFKHKVSNATTLTIDGKYNRLSGNVSLGCSRGYSRSHNSQTTTGSNGWKSSTTRYDGKADDYRVFAGINYALTATSVLGLQYNRNFSTTGIGMQGLWSFHKGNADNVDTDYASACDMKLKSANNSFSASYLWQRSDESQLLVIADYATSHQANHQNILEQDALEPNAIDYFNDYDIVTATAHYDFITDEWKHKTGVEWGDANNNGQATKNNDTQRCSRDNNWLALYYTLDRQWEHWRANIGLRYEFDHTKTEQDVVIRYDKEYHDLLPSLTVGYRVNPDFDISASYRRMLVRPTYNQLRSTFYYNVLPQSGLDYSSVSGAGFMLFEGASQAAAPGDGLSPNVIYMNAEDIATGNPELRPTVTDRIALAAQYRHITAQLSYRRVAKAIQTIYQLFQSGTVCQSPVNIWCIHAWTLDLDYSYSTDRLNLFLLASGTLPHVDIYDNKLFALLHGNVQYRVLRHLTVGASLLYSTPWKMGYTRHNSTIGLNLGLRASLCRDRLMLGAEVNDVFNRGMSTRSETAYMGVTNALEVNNDLRSVSLMIRWTFNSVSNPFKRRSGNDATLQRTKETVN